MADFQQCLDELRGLRAEVVAGSVDEPDDARKTVDRHDLTFPVAHGLDAEAFARATGAFIDPERGIIHATGFIVRPGGDVAAAVYSTGPVGRYAGNDVVGMLKYWHKQG